MNIRSGGSIQARKGSLRWLLGECSDDAVHESRVPLEFGARGTGMRGGGESRQVSLIQLTLEFAR